jgi:hypothetical protein
MHFGEVEMAFQFPMLNLHTSTGSVREDHKEVPHVPRPATFPVFPRFDCCLQRSRRLLRRRFLALYANGHVA